jgi:hypothetical protein
MLGDAFDKQTYDSHSITYQLTSLPEQVAIAISLSLQPSALDVQINASKHTRAKNCCIEILPK